MSRRALPSPEMVYGSVRLALRLELSSLRHRPRPQSVEQRLAALPWQELPVDAPVEICWNEQLVPYVEAQNDRDLAVALGLVHAHLRLAQMELLRRTAQGRLAEVLGPVATGVDHALRLLDPGRAVPAIMRNLPKETRDWLGGFAAGINHHLTSASEPPLEFRLLGISAAPWTVEDVLHIGRLLAADVNWIVWLGLLRWPRGPDWPQLWERILADGMPEPRPATDGKATARVALGLVRSASNAIAVAGRCSATKRGWLAGDPHLALTLPCLWLAAACRSPSYNVAGLMIPGIPVMAIGRNPWIAWGGTNLHAASSELFDVSGLTARAIRERRVRLQVRWSRERELVLREAEYGPIVSDAPLIGGERAIALRWVGHEPSDEISALLALNRARDWGSFRRAAADFAIPGQTLVYVDRDDHVGRLTAAWLPRRSTTVPADFVSPRTEIAAWAERVTSSDLPAEFDPARGFVVSANERPSPASVVIGWFFSAPDRARRLTELLGGNGMLGLDDLMRLQQDIFARSAVAFRDRLFAVSSADTGRSGLRKALASWDGRYDTGSAGALGYELVLSRLTVAILPATRREIYGSAWTARELLARDIAALAPEILTDRLQRAIREAEPGFAWWRSWGAVHRLRLAHPLAAVPGLRRRFRFTDWPWPGSNDTVMKAAHGLVDGPHSVGYGSNARYLFDLSDLDANHLVLLGGQDGAPGSAAFLDQAALFRCGTMMRVPLRPETARKTFPHRTRIDPRR